MRISDWSSDVCSSDLFDQNTRLDQSRKLPIRTFKYDKALGSEFLEPIRVSQGQRHQVFRRELAQSSLSAVGLSKAGAAVKTAPIRHNHRDRKGVVSGTRAYTCRHRWSTNP